MLRLLRLLPLALLLGGAPARPLRVVSLNLCADQWLLALADPGQIVALTRLSRDPAMSAAADKARRFPTTGASAEEVIALRPDLVIAAPGRLRDTVAAIRGQRLDTLDLPPAESYAAIRDQARLVARAIGQRARGEALVAAMDRQLARVPRSGRGRTAAEYQRGGYVAGAGSLADELLRRVGLVNLAARLGKPALSRVSLEEMALARPDFLLADTGRGRAADRGAAMLHHPILAGIPRLRLPAAWIVCGGPAYPRAALSLARQLRQ